MAAPTKLELVDAKPSEQIVAKAAATHDTIDSAGRIITLRKPGVLAQYRLVEALGDSAKNSAYVSMVLPLLYVSAIDGDALPPLVRKSEVEALIQRLDEHGISAVLEGVQEHFSTSDPEADKAAIKK